jgi:hypothetical protein
VEIHAARSAARSARLRVSVPVLESKAREVVPLVTFVVSEDCPNNLAICSSHVFVTAEKFRQPPIVTIFKRQFVLCRIGEVSCPIRREGMFEKGEDGHDL